MKKVALILAHPNYESESRLNKVLYSKAKEMENVTAYNLYEKYPDFKIDIKREQEVLSQNDIIILQFPLYWYSSPALLKEWTDQVLTADFAYDKQQLLRGKSLVVATTAAGSIEAYKEEGVSVEQYLVPFSGVAHYTKMQYQKPFVVHDAFVITDKELDYKAIEYQNYITNLSK